MSTTDELILAAFSVEFDNGQGLSVSSEVEWVGVSIPGTRSPVPFRPFIRGDNGATSGNRDGAKGSFDAVLGEINLSGIVTSGPALGLDGTTPFTDITTTIPIGTYHLGTIVWDLDGIAHGSSFHFVNAFFRPAFDGFAGVGSVPIPADNFTFATGGIRIVPEPTTATLLGLGLAGLIVAARHRK